MKTTFEKRLPPWQVILVLALLALAMYFSKKF